jgi:hypothetical protein
MKCKSIIFTTLMLVVAFDSLAACGSPRKAERGVQPACEKKSHSQTLRNSTSSSEKLAGGGNFIEQLRQVLVLPEGRIKRSQVERIFNLKLPRVDESKNSAGVEQNSVAYGLRESDDSEIDLTVVEFKDKRSSFYFSTKTSQPHDLYACIQKNDAAKLLNSTGWVFSGVTPGLDGAPSNIERYKKGQAGVATVFFAADRDFCMYRLFIAFGVIGK